jgi:hypothetical protein
MELIRNGDFETGALEPGWVITGDDTSTTYIEAGGIYPSRYALRLGGGCVAEQVLHDAGYATGDLTFRLSRTLRSEFMSIGVRVEYDDGSDDFELFTLGAGGAAGWERKTVPVSRTVPVAKISLESHSIRTFLIDEVSLEGIPAYQVLPWNASRSPFEFLYPLGRAGGVARIPPAQAPDAMMAIERRLTRIEGRLDQLVDLAQQHLATRPWPKEEQAEAQPESNRKTPQGKVRPEAETV